MSCLFLIKLAYSASGGRWGPTIKHYPVIQKRVRPVWAVFNASGPHLEDSLSDPLSETYTAFDNNLRVLAANGMRTAFERAMMLIDIPEGTFQMRLLPLKEATIFRRASDGGPLAGIELGRMD